MCHFSRLATLFLILGMLSGADLPELNDSGLPVTAAEKILPDGALVHVQIGAIGATLVRLDAMVMAFVPERAVPPQFQPLLATPRPLLSFIGQQLAGAPLDAALIAQMSGIAADKPLSLTAYLGGNGIEWILAIPTHDRTTLRNLLVNILRPRQFAAAPFGKRTGWLIEGSNPNLPQHLALLTSADTLYCCTNQALAARLAGTNAKHLVDEKIASLLNPKADITVLINAAAVRPLCIMQLRNVAKSAPKIIADLRRSILRDISTDQVAALNLQLRMYAGIASLDELLDYGQCLALAGIETVTPRLIKGLESLDGLAVTLSIHAEAIDGELTILADGMHDIVGEPLPMKEISRAIASLPGERLLITAEGRSKPATPSHLCADWLDLAVKKLAALGHQSAYLSGAAIYAREWEKVPTPLDTLPWILTTATSSPTVFPRNVGLDAWLSAIQHNVSIVPDLQVFPEQKDGIVAGLFSERAAVENRNAKRYTRLLTGSIGDQRWGDSVARFRVEPRPGKVERLIYEDAWISRSGLFGYSQHELVNRIIAYDTVRNQLHLLQRVDGDRPCWLDGPSPAIAPVPPAVTTLLAHIPDSSDSLITLRALPILAQMVAGLDSLEQALRHDLDDYLHQSEVAINAHIGNADEITKAVAAVPIPLIVHSLNFDAKGRTLYLVLAGGLRYPRPAVAPVVQRLLGDFLAKRDADGGIASWRRGGQRRLSFGFSQRLVSVAWLVKSTGNAVWQEFFAAGDPIEQARKILGHPDDGAANPLSGIFVFNTAWGEPR